VYNLVDAILVSERDGIVVKKCTMCGELKSLVEFSVNKRNKTDGRQPKCKLCNKRYYQKNKKRVIKRVRSHYKENNGQILERRVELRKRPKAKKKKAELDNKYYFENKEKIQGYYKDWAKGNRDKLRKNSRRWYHNNLEHARMLSRISTQKRRKWSRQNGNNTLTAIECENLIKQHSYCEYCNIKNVPFVIEHIVPLSKGGQNCLSNVTIACYPCNLSKGNKLLSEWESLSRRE